MRKERNSFFESANYNMSASGNMAMPNNMGGFASNFMANQQMPMPLPIIPNVNNNPGNQTTSELESKIAKLERNINRLEARVSKLEKAQFYSQENYDVENNMYMV